MQAPASSVRATPSTPIRRTGSPFIAKEVVFHELTVRSSACAPVSFQQPPFCGDKTMAKIICGANELDDARWDGKTIDQVREELKTVLNIPEGASVLLNGDEARQTNVALREGDTLEFVKAAGEKGA